MIKKNIKSSIWCLVLLLILTGGVCRKEVWAKETEKSNGINLKSKIETLYKGKKVNIQFDKGRMNNASFYEAKVELGKKNEKTIKEYIKKNLEQQYKETYKINFVSFDIVDVKANNVDIIVDLEIQSKMALLKKPKESMYLQGMRQYVKECKGEKEKLAQSIYNSTLDEYNRNWSDQIDVGFLYSVIIKNNSVVKSNDINNNIYERLEVENGDYYSKVSFQKKATKTFQQGKSDLSKKVSSIYYKNSGYSTVAATSFSRAKAAQYAVAHATDEPEFNKKNGLGSDCANFVSKCVAYGGIPEDKAGKWYRGASKGKYGGYNWYRTGYNNNGGVVPYLKNKNYYYAVNTWTKATVGSIMYWNNKSHVALVSRIDGYNIFYSHHSNIRKKSTYYLYSTATNNVTFYVPR